MKAFENQYFPSAIFTKSNMVPLGIGLGGRIGKGYVILDGPVVIHNDGASPNVPIGEGGAIDLIKKIVIRCNPGPGSRYKGGELVNCTPRALLRNAITHRTKFLGELSNTGLGNGAPGTYQLYLAIPIWFADPNVFGQWNTALNADPRAYGTIQLEVHTGDIADCFAGNTCTTDMSGLSVRWVDERHDFPGDTFELYQEDHQTFIPQSKDDFTDGAQKSDKFFLSMLLMTESGVNRTLVDTILNEINIQSANVNLKLRDNDIRQKMFDDGWYDAAQVATGQYFIDLVDMNISAAIPGADLKIVYDLEAVSGPGLDSIRPFTRRYSVPDGYNAGAMSEYVVAAK